MEANNASTEASTEDENISVTLIGRQAFEVAIQLGEGTKVRTKLGAAYVRDMTFLGPNKIEEYYSETHSVTLHLEGTRGRKYDCYVKGDGGPQIPDTYGGAEFELEIQQSA